MANTFGQMLGAQWVNPPASTSPVTVPPGAQVTGVMWASAAGGTITVTPKGANQTGSAGSAITIAAGSGGAWTYEQVCMLGPGTIFAHTGMDMFIVTCAKMTTGA